MRFFDQPLSESIPEEDLKKPKEIIENLFGPQDFSGISLHYSKEGLRPWEAGAAFGKEIRLQPALRNRRRWRFADRDEVIAHEIVHALRSDLNEPVFEEMLAFSTARKRKWMKQALSQRGVVFALGALLVGTLISPTFIYGALPTFFFLINRPMRTFNWCVKKVGLKKMLYMSDAKIKEVARGEHTQPRGS